MSSLALHQARTAGLREARARDSQHKREGALAALEALERAGSPVTFASVAKAAGVSRWFVYTEGIREQVEAARRRQGDHGAVLVSPRPAERSTAASRHTDLMVAREEIRRLRAEREKLAQRLRMHLGAEIEGPEKAQLITRVAELECVNRQLVAERDAHGAQIDAAKHRIGELEDELSAARESLRKVIRDHNRGR
jgi:hypothetical protein